MRELNNTWAIILGGSRGLGLASAKKLASHGMNIVSVHRERKGDLKKINEEFDTLRKQGTQVLTFNLDALKEEKRKETLAEIKSKIPKASVRILLHSIAKASLKPMFSEGKNLTKQDLAMTINAMGISLYDWAKAVFEAKLFAENARIVSFTSEGNSKAFEGYAAVSAAKGVLEAITRNLALELAPHKITANCIQAGMAETESFNRIPGSEKLKQNALSRSPNKRLTKPEDVANAVYLLCRDEANWITGTVLKVDGGESLR